MVRCKNDHSHHHQHDDDDDGGGGGRAAAYTHLSFYMSLCLSVSLSLCLSVSLSLCLSVSHLCISASLSLSLCLSVSLSLCRFVYLSLCLSVSLSLCLFVSLSRSVSLSPAWGRVGQIRTKGDPTSVPISRKYKIANGSTSAHKRGRGRGILRGGDEKGIGISAGRGGYQQCFRTHIDDHAHAGDQ